MSNESNQNGEKKASAIKKVGSILKSKYEKKGDFDSGLYFAADTYFGELYFKEKSTGNFYKINTAACYKPRSKTGKPLPAQLVVNVCVNLEGEKSVEFIKTIV